MNKEEFMRVAIEEARNAPWPFGAVLVKDGKIVAQAGSGDENDPTAHAEVNVIRKACRDLKTSNLKDVTLYASCEPCALCIGATWYAGIRNIVFGNTIKEMMQKSENAWGSDLSFPFECVEWPKDQEIKIQGGILKDEVMELYPHQRLLTHDSTVF